MDRAKTKRRIQHHLKHAKVECEIERLKVIAPFVTSNGHTVSIQRSPSHYCDDKTYEVWGPTHDLACVDGDPEGYMSLETIVEYVYALEHSYM